MKLQKSPLGLLGAFSLKHLGQNPPEFGETVSPVVDVYDQYLTDQLSLSSVSVTVNAGATLGVASVVVPNGHVWRVHSIGGSHAVNAADVAITFALAAFVIPPSGAAANPVLFTQQTLGAPTARSCGVMLPRPLVLPPGWKLLYDWYASAAPANNTTVAATALIQEIDV